MTEVAAALKTFASGFGIPAYMNGSIPDPVKLPYISYPLVEPDWNDKATFYMQVWDRSTSNEFLVSKADEIVKEIGSGITISMDGGYIVLRPETPLVQFLVNGDYRNAYINLSINAFHVPGN